MWVPIHSQWWDDDQILNLMWDQPVENVLLLQQTLAQTMLATPGKLFFGELHIY